jgi:IS1 family transposase
MNRLTVDKRIRVVAALVEGVSMRSASRMAGVAINTVMKLVVDLGDACSSYQDKVFRNLACRRLQCDEIWSFVYAKARNVADAKAAPEGAGDVWTWTAIDADTKLVPSWRIGPRDFRTSVDFMRDLASRLASRVQITTDGLKAYLWAVQAGFNDEVDFAQLQKLYGVDTSGPGRYSPPVCVGTTTRVVCGAPDPDHVSTSYVERQNLTMRMSMRRFTRLTSGFSKKLENHAAAIAIHFAYYNFCRIHASLRVTPAMAAGVSDHVWELEELVALLGARERRAKPVAAGDSN